MADADHVQVTLKVQNFGITRAGFGTALILSHNAAFPDRSREYSDHSGVLDDWAADSPEAVAAGALFAQEPAPTKVKIGRAGSPPTQRYQINIAAVALGRKYELAVAGQGVTPATVGYTTKADLDFAPGDVTVGTDVIAEPLHGMVAGDGPYRVSNSGGGLPAGLAVDTNYWVIFVDANSYKLAASKANALAGTPAVDLTTAGTGTHTLRRNQNDVIIAQLEQALNAVVGKNFTAVQTPGAGETDHLLVTGNTPGAWFSLEMLDAGSLVIKQTHAAPGNLATELDAIKDVDNDWYYLLTLYNSQAYVLAAAAWVESAKKFTFVDVAETESITTAYTPAVSTDTLAELADLGYVRVHYAYHPSPVGMFSARLTGRLAALNPGAWTAKFKTLSGIAPVALSGTQRANIVARRANSYMLEMGRAITFEGTVGSVVYGFADVVVGLDAFIDDLRKGQFGIQVALDKVAYDDADVAMLEAEALASAARYSSPERPVLRRDPAPVVTFPKVATIAPATRALRILPDFRVKAELAGAVHKVLIDVVITP